MARDHYVSYCCMARHEISVISRTRRVLALTFVVVVNLRNLLKLTNTSNGQGSYNGNIIWELYKLNLSLTIECCRLRSLLFTLLLLCISSITTVCHTRARSYPNLESIIGPLDRAVFTWRRYILLYRKDQPLQLVTHSRGRDVHSRRMAYL